MTKPSINFTIAELVYLRSAVDEGHQVCTRNRAETALKHPGCENVYDFALESLTSGLEKLDKACVAAGVRSLALEKDR